MKKLRSGHHIVVSGLLYFFHFLECPNCEVYQYIFCAHSCCPSHACHEFRLIHKELWSIALHASWQMDLHPTKILFLIIKKHRFRPSPSLKSDSNVGWFWGMIPRYTDPTHHHPRFRSRHVFFRWGAYAHQAVSVFDAMALCRSIWKERVDGLAHYGTLWHIMAHHGTGWRCSQN